MEGGKISYVARLVKGYITHYLIVSLALFIFGLFSRDSGGMIFFGLHFLLGLTVFMVTEWRNRWNLKALRWPTMIMIAVLVLLKFFISSTSMFMFLVVDVILFEIIRHRLYASENMVPSKIPTFLLMGAMVAIYIDEAVNWVHPNMVNIGPSFDFLVFLFVLVKMFFTSSMLYFDSTRSAEQRQKETQFIDYSADFNNYFAHHINTPLTTAISNIEIVKYKLSRLANVEVLEKVNPNFDVVTEGLDNVSSTAKELANIHYLRSEVLRHGMEPWNPEHEMRELAAKHDIDLELVIDHWPIILAPEMMVSFTLDQVFANAKRYGKDPQKVRAVVATEDQYLTLSVFNLGNIPDFNFDILQPFQRGSNAAEGTGTGLGLSLVTDLMNDYECDFTLMNVGNLTRAQLKIPLDSIDFLKNIQKPSLTSVDPKRTTNVTSFPGH